MKKILLLIIALSGSMGWLGGLRAGENAGKPIEATAGTEFSITLDSNPTTGYAWQLAKPLDNAVVKSVRNGYQTTPGRPGEPMKEGVGGKETWTFMAVSPGKTTLEFKYVRSWEKDQEPVKTASYQVVVKDRRKK